MIIAAFLNLIDVTFDGFGSMVDMFEIKIKDFGAFIRTNSKFTIV